MTTLAYKNGVVAVDSQITASLSGIQNLRKSFQLDDGSIIALIGEYTSCYPFYIALKELSVSDASADREQYHKFLTNPTQAIKDFPELSTDAEVLWFVLGGVYVFHDNGWHFEEMSLSDQDEHKAWGSGAPYARGAMEFGASAVQAVAAASALDIYTGGEVRYHKMPHHPLPVMEAS